MTAEPTKQCRKCQLVKPITDFYRESKGAHKPEGKFRATCRLCWNGIEPEVTDDERKQFVKQFVLDHLQQHGETADDFFRHWLAYKYAEITQESVTRVINSLLKEAKVKVTRRMSGGRYEGLNFLALV